MGIFLFNSLMLLFVGILAWPLVIPCQHFLYMGSTGNMTDNGCVVYMIRFPTICRFIHTIEACLQNTYSDVLADLSCWL